MTAGTSETILIRRSPDALVSASMRTVVFLSLCVLAACGDNNTRELPTPQECNPLGGTSCITPWPSALYEVDDATTISGKRLAIPVGALPTNIDDITIDPELFDNLDGFSSAAPMVTAFSTGVDGSNLVPYANLAASVTDASPTVIVDMSTGELVEHWAELDASAADTPDKQALYIRPSKLLKGSTRYAVAIKKTLKAKDGGELPIPEGFQAILDDEPTSHVLLEAARSRYTDIFAALEAHGIQRTDLVTAWDFTTASRESIRADLVNARDTALAMIGTNGANLTFTIDNDEVPSDARFARRIDGTYDVPLFLTNNGIASGSSRLQRDAEGKPMATGMYRVPFTALVPQCAMTATDPVPMMIYGHGLLGKAIDQVSSGGAKNAAAGVCAVVLGTDMRGMSEQDVPNVALSLNDANNGRSIFDVLVQGMVNHVVLVQLARGAFTTDVFTKTANGPSLVDPDKFYYYGISQGGIMGTTVCAIDPVIEKCVLQVGAINYSILLERSHDWETYSTILRGAYPDPLDQVLIINLMQTQWDRTEPTGVADVIVGDGFPGTPKKHVFMQFGIGDVEVSNLGSEYQARTMGIPVITPSPYIPQGLVGTDQPVESGVVIYDFGVGDTIPTTNTPPPENDVHSNLRNKQATVDMMKHFYETGEIVQMCTGEKGCDCTEAGACGAGL